MSSIFISHASRDFRFAERLSADLTSRGLEAHTFRDILPSNTPVSTKGLDPRLENAIDRDKYFVPLLSPHSVQSRWVGIELTKALESESIRKKILVIPALVERCATPAALALRTPSDFTISYEVGLHDLISRLSAPRTSLDFDATEQDPAAVVGEELESLVTRSPEALYALSPRRFEELVANVFRSHFDLEIQLSSTTRDGGVDIVVLAGQDRQASPVLVQCKRHSSNRRVGVEAVRSLAGAMALQKAKRGVIVTTTGFTASAAEAAQRLSDYSRDRWTLELVDYDRLLSWLRNTPNLAPDITVPTDNIHDRYTRLVDKKFSTSLTPNEEKEMKVLARELDEREAEYYEPLKRTLLGERDQLLRRRHQKGDDK